MLSKKELELQRLASDVDHQRDSFNELKSLLLTINGKLDVITTNQSLTSTKVAVLDTQLADHLRNHESSNRSVGVFLTVLTIILNILFFTIQHFVLK